MHKGSATRKTTPEAKRSRPKALVEYEDIIARDKTSLDIFWIRDESLADLDNLPDPDVLAEEIIENLEAGVESFKQIMESINAQ